MTKHFYYMFRYVLILSFFIVSLSMAQITLNVGDPAPKFKATKWIKGTPVTSLENGKIYVVEFWATWCNPCRESIPHLTQLAHKFKGKVTFIGMDGSERAPSTEDKIELIKGFVEEMGNKMDYSVALDADKFMIKNWMDAAGQDGIPCAFIVNKNTKIAWIGYPWNMDSPLEEIVENSNSASENVKGGTSTPQAIVSNNSPGQMVEGKAFAAKYKAEQERIAKENAEKKKFDELAKPITDALNMKDYAKVVAECEILAAKEPSLQSKLDQFYLKGLLQTNPEKAMSLAEAEKFKNSQRLTAITRAFTQKGLETKFYNFAIDVAAGKIEKDPDDYTSLSCLASAYELTGKNAKAVEIMEKMIVIAESKGAKEEYLKAMNDKIAKLKTGN